MMRIMIWIFMNKLERSPRMIMRLACSAMIFSDILKRKRSKKKPNE